MADASFASLVRRSLFLPIAVLLSVVPLIGFAQEPAAPEVRRVEFVRVVGPGGPHTILQASRRYAFGLELRNTGTVTWYPSSYFRVSYHWRGATDDASVRDGIRTEIGRIVKPNETVSVCAAVKAPDRPGTYELQWDLVQDGVAWFSDHSEANLYRQQVIVQAAHEVRAEAGRSVNASAIAAVVGVTIAHFLLTWWWLRSWRTFRHDEEHACAAIVIAFGSLQAVLYFLLFSVGISVWRGTIVLAAIHGIVWMLTGRRRQRAASPSETHMLRREGADAVVPSRGMVLLKRAGMTLLVALAIQWIAASGASDSVGGTDAAHYHVPHAINFLNGAGPFGLIATPHRYPMGTSVTAAWFMSATRDTLLLDLATLPSFVLLIGSLAWLTRLTTSRDGYAITPWVILLLCATPLMRTSLLMSADLFYTAAFIATFVQLLSRWLEPRRSTFELLLLGSTVGLLLSTKTTGVFSAAVLLALYAVAVLVRRLVRRESPISTDWRRSLATLSTAMALAIATGGIWTIRNTVMYRSPTAPAGLTVMGRTVFEGAPYETTRYYLSVQDDLRRPGYSLTRRFRIHSRRWLGKGVMQVGWLFLSPIAAALLWLGHSQPRWRHYRNFAWGAAAFGLVALVHVATLAGAPWTSLEWTQGLSLRYVLPFLVLYVALAACALALRWPRGGWWSVAQDVVLGAAAALTVWYFVTAARSAPAAEFSFPKLHLEYVALATAVVLLAVAARAPRLRMAAPLATVMATIVLLALFGRTTAASHSRQLDKAIQEFERGVACQALDVAEGSDARRIALALENDARSMRDTCVLRRVYVAGRLDTPLDLQTVDFRSVVFDVTSSRSQELMRQKPPSDACGYLMAELPVDTTELETRLGLTGRLTALARTGRYAGFRIRSR